jgi:hypothetical protein
MLLINCLFRANGAAVLLTNKARDTGRCAAWHSSSSSSSSSSSAEVPALQGCVGSSSGSRGV